MSVALFFTTPPPSLYRPVRCTLPRTARSDSLDHLHQTLNPTRTILRRSPAIGLWNRFPAERTVQQLMEEAVEPVGEWSGYRRGGRKPWEIREGETEYRIRFDVPGMGKKDVRVWVEEGMLMFKAEKKEGEEEEEGEGKYGSRIALPENAVVEKIEAEVRDGVLYVTVPKAAPTSRVFDVHVK